MRELLKGGIIVSGNGTAKQDVLIEDEKIIEVGNSIHDDFSARRFQLPRQDAQKSGFTGSVRTDYAVAVTFRKLDVYVFKKRLFTQTQGNIRCAYHNAETSPV